MRQHLRDPPESTCPNQYSVAYPEERTCRVMLCPENSLDQRFDAALVQEVLS